MHPNSLRTPLLVFCAVLALAACGGGNAPPSAPPVQAMASTSFGVASKAAGSSTVTVNGVAFATNGSTVVRIDDNPKGVDDLRSGMVVKVRARDDGTGRTAERIEVENELRGAVTAVDPTASPQNFTVGGLRVLVDDATVYANLNPLGFAGIAVGGYVEVHGIRDAAGNLRATRVEGQARDNANPADELKGAVGALDTNANTFTLGAVTVNYTGATFSPTGTTEASLANGVVVEVHGAFNTAGTVFTATRVDIEDLEDDNGGLRPRDGERNETEGFVANLSIAAGGTSGTFTLNGRAVSFSASTQFRGGSLTDLANNVRVEVDGAISGSTLVAREIRFKQSRVLLATQASAVDPVNGRLTLFGRSVQVNDLTEVRTPLSAITPNATRVEVRAFIDSTGALIAERIEASNSGGPRDIVQAVVSAADPAARTVTLLGITAFVNAASFRDINDQPISEAQFFAAITPNRTTVKVKGASFNVTSLGAEEVEIEN
ncbi:MAG: DUF5666 domain-containing protein [Pseudomonadota bacterium]